MDRLISEKKAIEAINDYWGEMETPTIDGYINAIKAIPSAKYETEITKYSDDEKYKALITLYFASINCEDKEKRKRYNTAIKLIEGIPSAEPKTGHWIRITNGAMREKYICSKCGRQIEDDGIEGLLVIKYPYCHCGAKMVETQESEEV